VTNFHSPLLPERSRTNTMSRGPDDKAVSVHAGGTSISKGSLRTIFTIGVERGRRGYSLTPSRNRRTKTRSSGSTGWIRNRR
jgi:hypothetical protein